MIDPTVYAELQLLNVTLTITTLPEGTVGLSDVPARQVWVSRDLTPAELRCTVMHELAHIALRHHPTGDPAHDGPLEDEADAWAAERLIPDSLLHAALRYGRDERDVAEYCRVDMGTLRAKVAASHGAGTVTLLPRLRPVPAPLWGQEEEELDA